jgi:hypothetical protein
MSLSIWLAVVERKWRRKLIGLWMNIGDDGGRERLRWWSGGFEDW